ncbi:MAG TPA: hypothetical protein VN418_03700, partial [Gammaproteobacteria bacterium]|nr:hypothetical protein [Gammaproteobacteria bacterium]
KLGDVVGTFKVANAGQKSSSHTSRASGGMKSGASAPAKAASAHAGVTHQPSADKPMKALKAKGNEAEEDWKEF